MTVATVAAVAAAVAVAVAVAVTVAVAVAGRGSGSAISIISSAWQYVAVAVLVEKVPQTTCSDVAVEDSPPLPRPSPSAHHDRRHLSRRTLSLGGCSRCTPAVRSSWSEEWRDACAVVASSALGIARGYFRSFARATSQELI